VAGHTNICPNAIARSVRFNPYYLSEVIIDLADFKLASSINYCSETSVTPTSVPTPLPVRSDLTLIIYQRSLLTLADSILASSINYCSETSVTPTSVPTPLPVRSDLTLIIYQRSLLTLVDSVY
jgi:hypothetical protein